MTLCCLCDTWLWSYACFAILLMILWCLRCYFVKVLQYFVMLDWYLVLTSCLLRNDFVLCLHTLWFLFVGDCAITWRYSLADLCDTLWWFCWFFLVRGLHWFCVDFIVLCCECYTNLWFCWDFVMTFFVGFVMISRWLHDDFVLVCDDLWWLCGTFVTILCWKCCTSRCLCNTLRLCDDFATSLHWILQYFAMNSLYRFIISCWLCNGSAMICWLFWITFGWRHSKLCWHCCDIAATLLRFWTDVAMILLRFCRDFVVAVILGCDFVMFPVDFMILFRLCCAFVTTLRWLCDGFLMTLLRPCYNWLCPCTDSFVYCNYVTTTLWLPLMTLWWFVITLLSLCDVLWWLCDDLVQWFSIDFVILCSDYVILCHDFVLIL